METEQNQTVQKSTVRYSCAACGAAVTRDSVDGSSFRYACGHVGAAILAKVSADLLGRGGMTREG